MSGLPSPKLFRDLWESGYRLLSEEEMDSFDFGMMKVLGPGHYEFLTIKGMKEIAKKNGTIKFRGSELTEEEVEMFWNIAVFKERNKNKKK